MHMQRTSRPSGSSSRISTAAAVAGRITREKEKERERETTWRTLQDLIGVVC